MPETITAGKGRSAGVARAATARAAKVGPIGGRRIAWTTAVNAATGIVASGTAAIRDANPTWDARAVGAATAAMTVSARNTIGAAGPNGPSVIATGAGARVGRAASRDGAPAQLL